MFNLSVRLGLFPDCLKVARIIPLFKSGNRKNKNNYRPISTLPVLSKFFEKLAHARFASFVDDCNIIADHQFGFQPNVGTSSAILEYLQHAYNSFECSNIMLSVFIDFSKAFDTVNHSILLRKLYHLGFRGAGYDWLESYLADRVQYVDVGGTCSQRRNVAVGVPQGSTLGPLLFLLYVNDMHYSVTGLSMVSFADDTSVYIAGDNAVDLQDTVNDALCGLNDWVLANRMSLNTAKTTYMTIPSTIISFYV